MLNKTHCLARGTFGCVPVLVGGLLVALPAWGWQPQGAYDLQPVAPPQYRHILAAKINQSEQMDLARFAAGGPTLHGSQDNSGELAAAALHASSVVRAFGWRVDSRWGGIAPWAEVSYQRTFTDDDDPLAGQPPRENSHWMDVTLGAHLPLSQDLSAFASFSQTGSGGLNNGEQLLYNFGINARF